MGKPGGKFGEKIREGGGMALIPGVRISLGFESNINTIIWIQRIQQGFGKEQRSKDGEVEAEDREKSRFRRDPSGCLPRCGASHTCSPCHRLLIGGPSPRRMHQCRPSPGPCRCTGRDPDNTPSAEILANYRNQKYEQVCTMIIVSTHLRKSN